VETRLYGIESAKNGKNDVCLRSKRAILPKIKDYGADFFSIDAKNGSVQHF
jgi:hypothetical protein